VKHNAVLVGTTYFQNVTFSTDSPDEGASFTYTLQTCDTELATWMTVTSPSGAELRPDQVDPWPPGEASLRTVVRVAVPGNATLGARHCGLWSKFCPPGPDAGVSICTGAYIPVDLVLTDQMLVSYATKGATLSPYYVKMGDPVHVQVDVENAGNVDVTSLQVEARVWPYSLGTTYAGPYTAQGTNSALTKPIPAYQVSPRATIEMFFPFTSLALGKYYLGVRTYNADGVDYQNSRYLEVYRNGKVRSRGFS
jgi:hypothetical protein